MLYLEADQGRTPTSIIENVERKQPPLVVRRRDFDVRAIVALSCDGAMTAPAHTQRTPRLVCRVPFRHGTRGGM